MRKTLLISAFIVLLLIPGSIWAYPPVPRSNILIEEIDGSPSDYIHTLKVSNGALTIANKVGTLSISTIANYGDDAQFYLETYSTNSIDYSRFRLRKSDSNTVLDETNPNDYLGIIQFEGANTTPAFAAGARIWAKQTAAAGAMIPTELRLNVSDDINLFSEQLVLSDDFRVGVGILENEKPLATFHIQGTAYVPLTGTVTTVRNTTGVEGAGTDFVSELFVGAPIRITSDHGTAIFSEVFTVAAITDADTLTLDSNYEGTGTAGLTAWTDGDLFKVSDREKNVKLTVDKQGKTSVVDVIRGTTSLWWHAYCVDAVNVSPGASAATWLAADANHLAGYQLNAAAEYLYLTSCLHNDWDGASDIEIKVTFEIMGAGTGAGDKERIIAQCYYKGHDGAVATKTQSPYGDVTIDTDGQYTLYVATIIIVHDLGGNVVDVGDKMSIRLNLDTANSDVDDILISHINFRYKTAKINPEI